MFLRLSGLGWPRSYQPIILLVITLQPDCFVILLVEWRDGMNKITVLC